MELCRDGQRLAEPGLGEGVVRSTQHRDEDLGSTYKTSRNSVLLQSNINNTRSDVAHLIRVLVEISSEIDSRLANGGPNVRQAFHERIKSLMTDVPDLPNFLSGDTSAAPEW